MGLLDRISYWPLGTADIATRTGVFAAIASVGPSFDPGLMPRNSLDQAAVTGITSSINFGLAATSQSAVESAARWVASKRRKGGEVGLTRTGVLAADLVGIGVGVALQRLLAEERNEPTFRALARTAAYRLEFGALSGALTVGTLVLADAIDPTGRLSRAPVVAASAALTSGVIYSHGRWKAHKLSTPDESTAEESREPLQVRAGQALGTAAVVSATLLGLGAAERAVSGTVAAGVRRARPDAALLAAPIGHAVALGGLAAGLYVGGRKLYEMADAGGNAIEAAYREVPSYPTVSGGPKSLVDWNDFGREGRRFVNMMLTAEDIEAVMSEPAVDPIRAFVGVNSAANEIERADLAMRELEELGAFDRPLIVIYSPTGSGYVNYVAAETIEYHTRGNVASVCIQYSVRPSGLSLDRVDEGMRHIKHFTNALTWRLRGIPAKRRPRVVLFGESLGCWAALDAFTDEGVAGLHRATIDRAMMVGTPGLSEWSQRWRSEPSVVDPQHEVVEVDSFVEWLAHDAEVRDRNRLMLLSHHNDPVVKLTLDLVIRQPDWMGPPATRPPGVPRETTWRPIYSFVSILFDFKNSMDVKPGKFIRYGHDYRTDLGSMVPEALSLPPVSADQHANIEAALRRRETEWAVLREGADRLEEAEKRFRSRLEQLGVPIDSVPQLAVEPEIDEMIEGYEEQVRSQARAQAVSQAAAHREEGPVKPAEAVPR